MPTAEDTIDLKDAFSSEDLPLGRILELRRSINCSIERRSELERLLDSFADVAKKLSSENKADTRKATVLWVLGRVEEAIPLLEAARASREKSYLLGVSYLDVGSASRAVEPLKDAHDADTSDPLAASAYAEALVRAGQADDADKLLDKLTKKHTESGDVHYVRGLWNDYQGNRADALEAYEKAMEVEPGHARSLFRIAYTSDLLGDDARALELYEQLRKMRPLHVNTMLNLGVIYEDRGDFEKADDCFRSVLDYYPNNARARLYHRDAQASLNMFYDEDAARREQKLSQVLLAPLADLQFSQRVRGGLANLGLTSIGDLCSRTEEDLLEVPNFGKTSLREVRDFLAAKGLSLASGSKDGSSSAIGAAPGAPVVVPGGNAEATPISSFEWSGRIKGAFDKLGINVVGDLLKRSEIELMGMRNLGITSIKEIRKKLGTLGVAMRPE